MGRDERLHLAASAAARQRDAGGAVRDLGRARREGRGLAHRGG